MPSSEVLVTFLLATTVFAYMPGPATLYTAAQTIGNGRRAGWLAALGLHIGGYAHVIASALGISVLLTAVPALYSVIKIVGACYLVWLGVQLFRSKDDFSKLSSDAGNTEQSLPTFRQSATVELLNPKTVVFYIAFLPQFTDPAAAFPLWGQLLILGTVVNILFSSADVLCVILSSTVMQFFKETPTGSRMMQRIGGSILIGLGINLALTGR